MTGALIVSEPWMPALANHLWQSTVVVAVAWLLSSALRHAPARARFWVWMAASLKFLLPVALLSAMAGASISWSHARLVIPCQGSEHSAVMVVQEFSHPLQQHTPASVLSEESSRNSWQSMQEILLPVFAGAWFVGFILILSSWLNQWLGIRRAVRMSTRMDLPFAEGVEVRVSSAMLEPGIFGIFRPVLLLPESVISRLPEAQVRAVIDHELSHIRRRDNLTALLHMAVTALFWFHPAVWWIRAKLLEERESACDEAVLESGNIAELYAESILSVCRICVESPLPCLSGITGSDLKRRIVHIMSQQSPRTLGLHRKVLLVSTAVIVFAMPVLLGLMQVDHVHAQTAAVASTKVPSSYDVISIHPHKAGVNDGSSWRFGDGQFDGQNVDLAGLFANAYGIRTGLVFGIPSWANGQRWDIQAKMVDITPEEMKKLKLTTAQDRQFVVNMLADRYHAKVHWETKQLPIYNLIVDKNGPKFAQNAAQNSEEFKPVSGGGMVSNWGPTDHKVVGKDIEIKGLADNLADTLSRDVIDQTGLKEKYSFVLKYAPPDAPAGSDTLPSLFPALQEQLGLKLVPAKGPIETLVIDHVDPPTDN